VFPSFLLDDLLNGPLERRLVAAQESYNITWFLLDERANRKVKGTIGSVDVLAIRARESEKQIPAKTAGIRDDRFAATRFHRGNAFHEGCQQSRNNSRNDR
jgi:hypothetical protein